MFFLRKAMEKVGVANPMQVVSDGQEGIDYLQGAGKFFDRAIFPLPCLVLLALKLPCMTGLEVLDWIRKQHSTALPVIIFSASEDEADIAAAYRLGANAFLRKPFESRQLVDIAKAIREFWLTQCPSKGVFSECCHGTDDRPRFAAQPRPPSNPNHLGPVAPRIKEPLILGFVSFACFC